MGQQPVKPWKVALFFVVALIVLMGATLLFMPRQYQVSRSQLIEASPAEVSAALQDLARWPAWVVWLSTVDQTVQITYGDKVQGPGAELSYRGERLGAGRFVVVEGPTGDLQFEGYEGVGETQSLVGVHRIVVQPEGEQTRVIWSMVGQVGKGSIDNLAVGARERLAVRDFDASLLALKQCVEEDACGEQAGRLR